MTQRIARFLGPLALFEWGTILSYFYFNHRLAGFLHPSFRPPVLVTGFLLMLAAACLLFSEDKSVNAHLCDDKSCDHAHVKLTLGGLLSFLVLLLPILLAAKISPDSYGAALVQNRGAAESLESVPGAFARVQHPLPSADMPAEPSPPDEKNLAAEISKGFIPPNAPEFLPSKNVPDLDYPSNEKLASLLRGDELIFPADLKKPPRLIVHKNAPMKAVNEQPDADTPFGSFNDLLKMVDSPLHNGSTAVLKTGDAQRCLAVEFVDLLVAEQSHALMKKLDGRCVESTGQVLGAGTGNFRLLRLLVLCCAADAQPLAVRVEAHGQPRPAQMTWVRVAGKVTFIKKGKTNVPVITAEKIRVVPQPDEPFIF